MHVQNMEQLHAHDCQQSSDVLSIGNNVSDTVR